jgi:hypothetical protein
MEMWGGNNKPPNQSFEHHSEYFKDPATGVHTNIIEGTWNGLKMQINPRNRVEEKINDHLREFPWRKANEDDLWNPFINALEDIMNKRAGLGLGV